MKEENASNKFNLIAYNYKVEGKKLKLSERKKEILLATIEDYIKDASPITSNCVKERHLPNISSATLRFELNALEAMGFLKQLHTSGGRIPTTQGYRFYVENLLGDFKFEPSKIDRVGEILSERTKSVNEIVSELANLISEATNYPTVVMMDGYDNLVIEEIKIVSLLNETALILLGTRNGIVSFSIKSKASQKSCDDAAKLLTKKFHGETIGFMTENINLVEKEINKEVGDYKFIAQSLLNELKKLSQSKYVGVKNKGSFKLLESGEERTVVGTKRTLQLLEDEDVLENLLLTDEKELSVDLSDDDEALGGVAIVKAPLVVSGRYVGTIGVFGPQRMDYMSIASALKFLTNEMENLDRLEDKK